MKTYFETKSFKTVQARYRRKLNFKNFPSLKLMILVKIVGQKVPQHLGLQ